MAKTYLYFNQMTGAFLGEFAPGSAEANTLPDDQCPVPAKRRGNQIIFDIHPMMSPLPDLVIENASEIEPAEVWKRITAWWAEKYEF
ncbi:hypothetical protein SAMN03159338_1493 [Sphingomonas sp. NFR04]|uniref:hypothetical protein n=1 Tax=Sphingomonas sp. NFR04 TaxID=1566283 RepID=UPI0008E97167|nr:hypothetical protein [Sphingomonas sp. NFR04]SFJ47478.1 hypothetical protein SAMN03159338_1493 [Sphingomonas sp. NFR04]